MPHSVRITKLFETLEVLEPDPQTALEYTTPFSLVVSVLLSAQATDQSVNRVMASLRPEVDTPQKVIALGEEALVQRLRSINYYRHKTHYIVEMAGRLIRDFNGQVPHTREELLQLPGVGPKTANVVLNVLMGSDHIAVDTHVFRLAHRLGLSEGSTPNAVEEDLYKVVPQRFWGRLNHWFTRHGRTVCMARHPQCDRCCLAPYCPSQGLQEALEAASPKKRS